ncbi:hypothetical protein ASD02_35360 [Ensifer sp. Root1252]|nr:hypothetical protein ASD02_35360 [Ensifer sp. Root1252]KRC67099.1 hypothetical protein ASE32_35590 [Ensifer sp. Root231]KRC93678.1 hypothetical protein ASE47_35445 [Ensifer sp. Root258]
MSSALRTFFETQKNLKLFLAPLQSFNLFDDLLKFGERFIAHTGLFIRDALFFFCDPPESFFQ